MLCLKHESISSVISSKIDGEKETNLVRIKCVGTSKIKAFDRFAMWKRRSSQKPKSMAAISRFNILCINNPLRRKQLVFQTLSIQKEILLSNLSGNGKSMRISKSGVPEFT